MKAKFAVLVFLVVMIGCATIPPEEVRYEATVRVNRDLVSDDALYEATLEWMAVTLPTWHTYSSKMAASDALFFGATGVNPTGQNTEGALGVIYESDEGRRIRGVGRFDVFYAIMSYPVRFNVSAHIDEGTVRFIFDNMIIARQGGGIISDRGMFETATEELDKMIEHYKGFLNDSF